MWSGATSLIKLRMRSGAIASICVSTASWAINISFVFEMFGSTTEFAGGRALCSPISANALSSFKIVSSFAGNGARKTSSFAESLRGAEGVVSTFGKARAVFSDAIEAR